MDFDWLGTRIRSSSGLEAALNESAAQLCKAFGADRITVYRASADGAALAAIVQMGLEGFGTVKVRVDSNRSVAGYVGSHRRLVNIGDAYDEKELAPLALQTKMFVAVDQRTGYTTRQVLAAPILAPIGRRLLGVVELFNRRDRQRFPKSCEEDLQELCIYLGPAFEEAPEKSPAG